MRTALIGYTGFVGGNLGAQATFDDLYNSQNIEEIRGKSYDLVVSAAGPAERWKANQDPDRDRAILARLTDSLAAMETATLVLVSTIDVYARPLEVDEDDESDPDELRPYGKHRLEVERFVASRFDATRVRLPNLFGPGLKKNVVYDLLNDNMVDQIHADGVFQYYNLRHIWKDVQVALEHDLSTVNFATEPVSVGEIAREAFGMDFDNRPTPEAPRFDFRSKHAKLFGGEDGYLYDKWRVLAELAEFVEDARSKRS